MPAIGPRGAITRASNEILALGMKSPREVITDTGMRSLISLPSYLNTSKRAGVRKLAAMTDPNRCDLATESPVTTTSTETFFPMKGVRLSSGRARKWSKAPPTKAIERSRSTMRDCSTLTTRMKSVPSEMRTSATNESRKPMPFERRTPLQMASERARSRRSPQEAI